MDKQTLGEAGRPYSQALRVRGASELIFVSGQLARANLTTAHHQGSMVEQAREIFSNIEKLLAQAGATMDHVVKITAFVTTLEGYDGYSALRKEVFKDPLPASATVQVTSLVTPGCLIEIEAVAALP